MSTQLPFDIELLIIQRLPIKSLLQVRSVCKAWNSFISSSDFITFHHAHSQKHFITSYKNIDRQLKYVSVFDDFALTVPPLVQGTRVLSSSHGLLCMIDPFDSRTQTKMAVLWNPAIKKSIAVIVPRVVDDQQFNSVVAFGICPATMDPKLVKITFINDESKIESISCIPFQVMVFTLSSGKWTTLCTTNLPSKSIVFDSVYQTVIGQFIYLTGRDWSVLDDNRAGRSMIMSFDLTTHEFKEVDIPNSLRRRSSHVIVSRVRESLVLLDIEETFIDGHSRQLFYVWMMMDDSKVFTELFTINPPNATVWCTLGFRESGEPIIESTYDEMDGTHRLAVYEPGLEDINDLGIRGNPGSFYGSSYTESLLLLDHEDGRIIRC